MAGAEAILDSEAVDRAVAAAVSEPRVRTGSGRAPATRRFLLAVSGGRDSMVLLDSFARIAPEAVAAAATFDHGTGPHAAEAVRLVRDRCATVGIRAVSGVAAAAATTESEWRQARWAFLRAAAARMDATVATAHTRDDNIETVLIRVLRGSGARGLAALHAMSDVSRPLLDVSRATVAATAAKRSIEWIEDPSNESRAHLRNRVRHEILPALLATRPALADELLDISRRAAGIRATLERIAFELIAPRADDGLLIVATAPLGDYDPEALRALWPAIAAWGGIVVDRRGTAGLARFTKKAAIGDRMQLSGAVDVVRRRDAIVLRRELATAPDDATLEDGLQWGVWRFVAQRTPLPTVPAKGDAWTAAIPDGNRPIVRAWRAGDRMHGAGDAAPRRVKRFLRDAGLVGPERRGWPVVVCGGEVVWIPGVRRSYAAAVRSGRPEAVYVCERTQS